jgi:hypothetical protein
MRPAMNRKRFDFEHITFSGNPSCALVLEMHATSL